jgi:topoisomerase-4 subunit A
VNKAEGFIGSSLKKDEFVFECSDLDDIIVFTRSGKLVVTKVGDKKFVGKDIMHIAVWKKSDERTTYNVVYYDGTSKRTFAKRFNVTSITRDKEYDIAQGSTGSKILYFTENQNAETEIVKVQLHPNSSARIKDFEFDFATLDIKGRQAIGNIVTKFPVRKVELVSKGDSSIGGLHLWFDAKFGRITSDQKEKYLGEFNTGDQLLVAYKDGNVELTNFEQTNKFDTNELLYIGKYNPETVYSCLYYDGGNKAHYVKRFTVELKTEKLKSSIVTDHKDSNMLVFSDAPETFVKFNYLKGKEKEKIESEVSIAQLIDVKGWKALGNRLSQFPVSGKIAQVVKEKPLQGKSTEEKEKPTIAKQGDLF